MTDEPNELVAPYHDRMPVVLGAVERWLNLDTTLDDVDPPSDRSVLPMAGILKFLRFGALNPVFDRR